jgi:hypothetical protein
MSEETPTPEPETPGTPDEGDTRDERIAAALAVEPLDEVTRRRLVRTAVASAPSRRPRLALIAPVAAAIVVGLVVGAVLVNRPDDPPPTAAPATADAPEPRAAGDQALEAAGAPPALGDLGDVTDPAALRQALATARDSEAARKAAAAATGCAAEPPPDAGAVVATATGTSDGESVVVVVGLDPEVGEVAIVLRATDCSVLQRVSLVAA